MRIKSICGVEGKLVVFWLDIGVFAEVWPYENIVRPVVSWQTPARFMPYDEIVDCRMLSREMLNAAKKIFDENPQVDYRAFAQGISLKKRIRFKEEAERMFNIELPIADTEARLNSLYYQV